MRKLIILIAVLVLFLVGVGLYFLWSRGQKSVSPTKTDLVIPSPIAAQNPYAEENVTAVFTYPQDASVEKGEIVTGGESEIITLAPDVYIEIQKKPYSSEIFEYMNNTMRSNGLTETQVNIGKELVPAIQYKGALPLEIPYQQLVTIFVANKTIYKIQLMYFSQSPMLEYEAEYQSLLDSINLL